MALSIIIKASSIEVTIDMKVEVDIIQIDVDLIQIEAILDPEVVETILKV